MEESTILLAGFCMMLIPLSHSITHGGAPDRVEAGSADSRIDAEDTSTLDVNIPIYRVARLAQKRCTP